MRDLWPLRGVLWPGIWFAALFSGLYAQDGSDALRQQARAHYRQARRLMDTMDYDSAYVYLARVIPPARRSGDSSLLFRAFFNMAKLDHFRGNLGLAEYHSTKAMTYAGNRPRRRALIYNLWALIDRDKGRYTAALQNIEKLRQQYHNNISDSLNLFFTYHNNRGRILCRMGRYDEALRQFDSILAIPSLGQKRPKNYARYLANKAEVLYHLGSYTEAFDYLYRAKRLREAYSSPEALVETYLTLSDFHRAHGSPDSARFYAERAYAWDSAVRSERLKLRTYAQMARTHPQRAWPYFELYQTLQDSLNRKDRRLLDQSFRILYETQQKEREIERQARELVWQKRRNRWLLAFLVMAGLFSVILTGLYVRLRRERQQVQKLNDRLISLYGEMHHQIRNNFMRFLIDMQKLEKLNRDPVLRKEIDEIKAHLFTYIEIHKLLQAVSKDKKKTFAFSPREITGILFGKYQKLFRKPLVHLQNDIDPSVTFKPLNSFVVSLMINEFMHNAFKYAFPDGKPGRIRIHLYRDRGRYVLEMEDNGVGFDPGAPSAGAKQKKPFSMLRKQAEQLEGRMEIHTRNGVRIRITWR